MPARPDPDNAPGPLVHFGGPDMAPRALRNLLQARVDAVPPGGWIRWATYYFRDEALAAALVAAHARGVDVRLFVEGRTRQKGANDAVLAILRRGLPASALRAHEPPTGPLGRLHGHAHAKIYAASHPHPHALVGSFNPSGNDPEDLGVVAEIGDQDRGHNLLVELIDPGLVSGLARRVERLFGAEGGGAARFLPSANRVLRGASADIWFFPRLSTGVLDRALDAGRGDRLRGAVSHLKAGRLTARLIAAARAGAEVDLVVHDTERRVPESVVERLAQAGVRVRRYRHPDGLPMHAKFLLIEGEAGAEVFFGSFNLNPRSRWLNQEVLVRSVDRSLAATLGGRFEAIAREADGF